MTTTHARRLIIGLVVVAACMLFAAPAVAVLPVAQDYFVYGELDTAAPGFMGTYGADGYVGADGVDRVIFYKNDQMGMSKAFIYTVTTAGDPAQHPDNMELPGPVAARTFSLETSFTLGLSLGHDCEFYVDAVSDEIYVGAAFYGVMKYVPAGSSYAFDSAVTTPTPAVEWTQSLAFDPDTGVWYSGSGSGNPRSVLMNDGSWSDWSTAFTYPANPDGDHHDGMELVGGHLYLADYMGDYIYQLETDGTLLNTFTHDPFGHELEGMGFGALGHFWAGSHGDILTEFGGGELDIIDGITVESDCFTEQSVEIPVQMSFTIGHKLKVHVDTTNIVLGEKLLPGDEGSGAFTFTVWSNDDVECRITNSDFTGDDKGVNDEEADTVTCPDGLVVDDWDTDARYDEDEGAPFSISGDRVSIMMCGTPYSKGTWVTVNDGPTGDIGVSCDVELAMDAITYADHAGYYTGVLTLDVRQF